MNLTRAGPGCGRSSGETGRDRRGGVCCDPSARETEADKQWLNITHDMVSSQSAWDT